MGSLTLSLGSLTLILVSDRATPADRRGHGRRGGRGLLVPAQCRCRPACPRRHAVRVCGELGPFVNSDVSADGCHCRQRRHRRRPLSRGAGVVRPAAWRPCHRGELGVRRLRRRLRLERRGSGDHRAPRCAGNAQEGVRQGPCDRRRRLRRHARCADPAEHLVRHLRHLCRGLDRQAADGRHHPGHPDGDRLFADDRPALLVEPVARPARRRTATGRRSGANAGRRSSTSGRSSC